MVLSREWGDTNRWSKKLQEDPFEVPFQPVYSAYKRTDHPIRPDYNNSVAVVVVFARITVSVGEDKVSGGTINGRSSVLMEYHDRLDRTGWVGFQKGPELPLLPDQHQGR